jgi:superfamily I DNA/RNA helicase
MGYVVYELPELKKAPREVCKAIDELKGRLSKLPDNGVVRPPTLDPIGNGYFKKRIAGNRRLIARLLSVPVSSAKVPVLVLVDVLERNSRTYEEVLQSPADRYETLVEEHLGRIREAAVRADVGPLISAALEVPPQALQELLDPVALPPRDAAFFVPEHWLRTLRELEIDEAKGDIRKLLEGIADQHGEPCGVRLHRAAGGYRVDYVRLPKAEIAAPSHVFLLGLHVPTSSVSASREVDLRAEELWRRIQHVAEQQDPAQRWDAISQLAERAFPDYLLADAVLWQQLWQEREVFLALSTEEYRYLDSLCSGEGVPAIIEGRAGSGKSTLLYYYTAQQLSRNLQAQHPEQPPRLLYLTQSERLLEGARQLIEKLTERRRLEGTVYSDRVYLQLTCDTYHNFALQQLSPQHARRFAVRRRQENGGWLDFATFRDLLRGRGKYGFRGRFRQSHDATPEAVWFIIRSYIKGFKIHETDDARWMTAEEYAETDYVPRKERQVSEKLYHDVWEHVWPWYQQLTILPTGRDGLPPYWDDLDLAWEVLLNRRPDAPDFPLLVCDEVQDFSRIELAALLGCLSWRKYDYAAAGSGSGQCGGLPVILAGDGHQTVNPSCFRWERVRTDLAKALVCHLPQVSLPDVAKHELKCNYRNAASVGRLCNALQHLRQHCLGHQGALQELWRVHDDQPNQRIRRLYPFIDARNTVQELLEQGIFLIGPEDDDQTIETARPFWRGLGFESPPVEQPNYVTPAEIKGLEQDFVALVGFGTAFAQLGLDDFWSWRNAAENDSVAEADLFAAEYFFNRLYVAVSRAREQLWIVETEEGWNALWAKLEQWLQETCSGEVRNLVGLRYSDGSRGELIHVFEGNWLPLAKQLEQAAHDQRDPEQCERAAFYYDRAEKTADCDRMKAWEQYYRGRVIEAARMIERIAPEQAVKWLWEALAWQALADLYFCPPWQRQLANIALKLQPLSDPFDSPPATPAEEAGVATYVQELLDALGEHRQRMPSSANEQSWAPWSALHSLLTKGASRLSATHAPLRRKVFEYIRQFPSLVTAGSSHVLLEPLANLAYELEEWGTAIDCWTRLQQTAHHRYYNARAAIEPYPQCLQWLESAGRERAPRIVELYRAHPHVKLDVEARRRVARAASHLKDWTLALRLAAEIQDAELASSFWAACSMGGGQNALITLVEEMYDAVRAASHAYESARGQAERERDGLRLRWTGFLYDMWRALTSRAGVPSRLDAEAALVYGFSLAPEPGLLIRRVGASGEGRHPDDLAAASRLLGQLIQNMSRWIRQHASREKLDACAKLAHFALNLLWEFRERSAWGRESGSVSLPRYQSALRSYLLDATPQRPSLDYLNQISKEYQRAVCRVLRRIASVPNDFWRDATPTAAVRELHAALDALAYDLYEHLRRTLRAAQTRQDYGDAGWWLLVGRFVEHAPFRRRGRSFYRELEELALRAGWPSHDKERLARQRQAYKRRYEQWRQSPSVRSLSFGTEESSELLRIVARADRTAVLVMLRTKEETRIRISAPRGQHAPRVTADPGVIIRGPRVVRNEWTWKAQCEEVQVSMVWDTRARTLRLIGDETFELVWT